MDRTKNILKENRILKLITNRELFSIVYISTCILWFFPLLGWIINPISKICFLWGVIIIIWDFLFYRKIFQSSYWYILMLFLLFME